MSKLVRLLALITVAVLAVVAVGCGSGSSKSNGGTVTLLDVAGGIDSLDPGYWYYETDYTEIGQPTQMWLYGWKPNDLAPSPEIATGMPTVTNGGKTITIKIKPGIHYSAPLQNRTVKAADIKYAMTRCGFPSVGNGYFGVYYSSIKGAAAVAAGKSTDLPGITAPNDTTLVINTDKPVGVLTSAQALALPCTVPVPQDYAAKYDKGATSTYGQHQVFTGPYMVKGAQTGTIGNAGYQSGKSLDLVRNPSWNKSLDFKPAYLNEIKETCCGDPAVVTRQTLSGSNLMSGDFAAPPTQFLNQLTGPRKSQAHIGPSQGNRYIALNTKVKPLDNINVRKAIIAATDRTALRQTRGGPTIGIIATHFIPPGMPGFDEAGGNAGPGYDFYASPTANIPLAMSYMKKAGYPSGKYTGPPVLVVGDNVPPAKNTAEAFQAQMGKIGIRMNLREVPHATAGSKFCNVPKAAVAICPNLGWGKDFFDSQSMLDPIYNGKNIVQSGNTNQSQANDPTLNKMLDDAESITTPAARAKAWGAADKYATGQAFLDIWLWDNQVSFSSKNVDGAQSKFNSNDWDLTYTAVK